MRPPHGTVILYSLWITFIPVVSSESLFLLCKAHRTSTATSTSWGIRLRLREGTGQSANKLLSEAGWPSGTECVWMKRESTVVDWITIHLCSPPWRRILGAPTRSMWGCKPGFGQWNMSTGDVCHAKTEAWRPDILFTMSLLLLPQNLVIFWRERTSAPSAWVLEENRCGIGMQLTRNGHGGARSKPLWLWATEIFGSFVTQQNLASSN